MTKRKNNKRKQPKKRIPRVKFDKTRKKHFIKVGDKTIFINSELPKAKLQQIIINNYGQFKKNNKRRKTKSTKPTAEKQKDLPPSVYSNALNNSNQIISLLNEMRRMKKDNTTINIGDTEKLKKLEQEKKLLGDEKKAETDRAKALEDEKKALLAERKAEEAQLKLLEAEKKAEQDKLRGLELKSRALDEELKKNNIEIENIKKMSSSERTRSERLKTIITKITKSNEDLNKEKKELKGLMIDARQKRDMLMIEMDEAKKEIAKTKEDLEQVANEFKETKEENKQLKTDLQNKTQQLDENVGANKASLLRYFEDRLISTTGRGPIKLIGDKLVKRYSEVNRLISKSMTTKETKTIPELRKTEEWKNIIEPAIEQIASMGLTYQEGIEELEMAARWKILDKIPNDIIKPDRDTATAAIILRDKDKPEKKKKKDEEPEDVVIDIKDKKEKKKKEEEPPEPQEPEEEDEQDEEDEEEDEQDEDVYEDEAINNAVSRMEEGLENPPASDEESEDLSSYRQQLKDLIKDTQQGSGRHFLAPIMKTGMKIDLNLLNRLFPHIQDGRGKHIPKVRGLNGKQIDDMMSRFKPVFKGTYAIDHISDLPITKKDKTSAVVMNLDTSDKPGSHWVGLFFDFVNHELDYYDSYAEEPPVLLLKELDQLIDRINPDHLLKFKYNRIVQQRANSDTCGWFVMKFLINRMKGLPFKDATGYSEIMKSEKKIQKFKNKFGHI